MDVSTIPSTPGSRHRRKRVGRGVGSGHGKTATRGQKGQRARTGSRKRPGFEGGRNPLIRMLPKRGMRRKDKAQEPQAVVINVDQLNQFKDGARVTIEDLRASGLVNGPVRSVKLLGDGALTKKVTVVVHRASESALAKVTQAGGKIELIDNQPAS